MVEEEQTDPLEITKDPEIVKTAQDELCKVDVLVCGECHEVFHFVEEFQDHKSGDKCTKISILKQGTPTNSKSQLWGFMLWKNSKFKSPSPEENNQPSSWNIYQLWCNLDQTQKDSWIAAGKSLQGIHTNILTSASASKRTKMKLLNKKRNNDDEIEELEVKDVTMENDPLADTESDLDLEEELTKHKLLKDPKCENGGIKKTILQPVELNNDMTILPSSKMKGPKKAIRTYEGEKKGEYVVEKIVSKRYNPGKKTHEYLIKWENFPEEQNTWEPVAHLDSCRQLVDDFDRHLARLKAQKISRGSLVQRRPHKKSLPEKNSDLILTSTGPGRPQRTSKQKALNQVKVWCGNISDADEGGSGKRVFSDSDSDSFEKKMKLEEESSDSDDDLRPPSVAVRKVIKTPLNGISRKQPLPENILVPDAHGVVTINQKQLPALSSGVYVMSKTAGIIKLDSNTSKIAASGGHAVIKVAPKIGQTSIKVVKRSDPSNGSKAPTILNSKFKPLMRPIGAKVIAHRRPPSSSTTSTTTTSATIIKRIEAPKIETTAKIEDDESDGLEELPFPTDLPLPEPDSPPGEFTLCPLTGKVLGQDYPPSEEEMETDANVTIKQEVTETNVGSVQQQQSTTAAANSNGYSSLDVLNDLNGCNILTATDGEIKMEVCDQQQQQQQQQQQSDVNAKDEDRMTATEVVNADGDVKTTTVNATAIKQEDMIDKTQSIEAALSAMEGGDDDDDAGASSVATITTTIGMSASSSTSSILTTALSNANIEPSTPPLPAAQVVSTATIAGLPSGATLLKKSEVPEAIRQKTAMNRHIINRTIVPKPAPQAIITRITPGSVNRSKQQLTGRQHYHQKIVGGPPPTTFRKTIRQTYSNKSSPNVIRKVISANASYQHQQQQQSNNSAILTAVAAASPATSIVSSKEATAVATTTTLTSSSISTESLVETLTSPGPSEVINMPLLTDLETASAPTATGELDAEAAPSETAVPQTGLESANETALHSDLNTIGLDGSETPLLITGEDGTIYQVAGQNEDGQTILIAQDADGQQQCLLVASESASELGEPSPTVVNASTSTALVATQEQIEEQPIVMNAADPESDNAEDSQIVAQIVSAQPPSPGGTRKVVLMLPDGNLMMTEVTAEQYAALELDK
ncbi:putative chromatin organization modifier domain protein [Trypoxylus dichotomus]